MGQGGTRGAGSSGAPSGYDSRRAAAQAPDPEAWLEEVAFPEPADDPALAELEDEDLVLEADELEFDAEQWREASERYAASERGSRRRASAETARVRSRRTRALPRLESSRRRRSSKRTSGTRPTQRIPRASAPISDSVRTRAARSVTARLRPLSPRPASDPPRGRPSQPCWGATVRRPSFRISRGGLSKAQALAVSWPELSSEEGLSLRRRPPLELLALAGLCLGLLLAIGGPFLLRDARPALADSAVEAPVPGKASTHAALTAADEPSQAPPRGEAQAQPATPPSSSASEGAPALPTRAPGASAPRSGLRVSEGHQDARLAQREARARARAEAEEEALGAAGGARLRFGLACGTYGADAHVPLRWERLADARPARALSWELRHDPRLSVEAVRAGAAAQEASAVLEFEVLAPGRVRITAQAERPLGTGELCVVRLSVPPRGEGAPLPPYLPLEALALRLDDASAQAAAGAQGALRLEP